MPDAEARRLEAIRQLRVLDRSGDLGLERIVRLATNLAGVPTGAIHVLDATHQHRIAAHGVPLGDHPREDSMCRLVVEDGKGIHCVDATLDDRFGYTSFTRGDAPVRFYAAAPLRTSSGDVVGTLCVFDGEARELTDEQQEMLADLADLVVLHVETARHARVLAEAAGQDPLTGLANRATLHDRLGAALHPGPGRPVEAVQVAFVDLDRFKPINDTHGHDVGDAVLREVGRRLVAAGCRDDLVARFGGDEFVVVRSGPSAEAAPLDPAAIDALVSAPIETTAGPVSVGASVGLAVAQPGDTLADLLRRADVLMYEAKASRVDARTR